MATLILLTAVAVLGLVFLLLSLRWPVLMAVSVLFSMSLDYVGTLGLGLLTVNNLLKASFLILFALRLMLSGEKLRLPANLLHFIPFLLVAGLGSMHRFDTFHLAAMAWLRLAFIWSFALLLANVIRSERQLTWVLRAVGMATVAVAVLALVQALEIFQSGPLAIHGAEQSFRRGTRVSASFWNPNQMAVHVMGMSVVLFAALPILKRRLDRFFAFGALGAGFLAILLSLSRSGYLAVAVALLLFTLSRVHRRLALRLGSVALLLLLFVLVFTPYGQDLLLRFQSFFTLTEDRSGQIRGSLAISGLWIFAEGMNWIWGAGYESFPVRMVEQLHPLMNHDGFYHAGIRASHNLWITILAELGLLGLGAMLFFLRGTYRELARLVRLADSPLLRALAAGMAVYVGVKVVDFNFNPQFEESFFWFAMGMIGAMSLMAARREEETGAEAAGVD